MDLARLARMSRRRRRRHERRQKHGRAWGVLRSALVELVSVFLLCVVSFFALFGSRRSTAKIPLGNLVPLHAGSCKRPTRPATRHPSPDIKLQVKTDGRTSGKSKSAGETTSKTKEATTPRKSSSGQRVQSRQSEQPQRSPPPSNQPQQPPSVYRPPPIYGQPVPYDDPTYGQ